jgi:hypothetical protein
VAWVLVERDFSFHYDEWDFVLHQPTNAGAYFLPHNEHWSTVPILIYQMLLGTVGMRSHVPYVFVLVLLHITTALLLFWIVRRRAGDLLALLSMAVLLVLGWGADDFMWAFQISWQASAITGLLALGLLSTSRWNWLRLAASSALLVLCVASSGIGLAFIAAAAVEVALTAGYRGRLVALIPPVGAYTAWYLTVGHNYAHPVSLSLATAEHLGAFVLYGTGAGMAALSGAGSSLGVWLYWVGLIPLLIVVGLGCRRQLDARVIGSLAGVVTLLTLAGFVRVDQHGIAEAASSRYIYMVALFLLMLGAVAISRLPWTRFTIAPIAGLAILALTGNIRAAAPHAAFFRSTAAATSIDLRVLNAIRGDQRVRLSASPDIALMPQVTVGAFFAAEDRLGSPVSSASLQSLMSADPARVASVLNAVSGR